MPSPPVSKNQHEETMDLVSPIKDLETGEYCRNSLYEVPGSIGGRGIADDGAACDSLLFKER